MSKTTVELLKILDNLPASGDTNYRAMTYEQGIEETILWIIGEISNEEFSYYKK